MCPCLKRAQQRSSLAPHRGVFRNFSASNVRRFYGDIGYKNYTSEFHVNMGVADDNFGATATVPVECFNGITVRPIRRRKPSIHRVGYVNLTGKATPIWTIEGSAHVRVFDQETLD